MNQITKNKKVMIMIIIKILREQKINQIMVKNKKKIRGKYLTEYEKHLKNKSATTINRIFKGHLIRKKVKITRIYIMIMTKRITN